MKYVLVNQNADKQRLDSEDKFDALEEGLDILGYVLQAGSHGEPFVLVNLSKPQIQRFEIHTRDREDALVEAMEILGYSVEDDLN